MNTLHLLNRHICQHLSTTRHHWFRCWSRHRHIDYRLLLNVPHLHFICTTFSFWVLSAYLCYRLDPSHLHHKITRHLFFFSISSPSCSFFISSSTFSVSFCFSCLQTNRPKSLVYRRGDLHHLRPNYRLRRSCFHMHHQLIILPLTLTHFVWLFGLSVFGVRLFPLIWL